MKVEFKGMEKIDLICPAEMGMHTLYEVVQSPHQKHIGWVVFRVGDRMVAVHDTPSYWTCLESLSQIKLRPLPAGAQVIWTQD